MGVYGDIQVKATVSTNTSRQTPTTNLHGTANGLVMENFQNQRQYAAREGAYTGQVQQADLKLSEGNFPFTVLENSAMANLFYGKTGQFLDLEIKTYDSDGSTLIKTWTLRIAISVATPVLSPRAENRIRVDGPILYENVA